MYLYKGPVPPTNIKSLMAGIRDGIIEQGMAAGSTPPMVKGDGRSPADLDHISINLTKCVVTIEHTIKQWKPRPRLSREMFDSIPPDGIFGALSISGCPLIVVGSHPDEIEVSAILEGPIKYRIVTGPQDDDRWIAFYPAEAGDPTRIINGRATLRKASLLKAMERSLDGRAKPLGIKIADVAVKTVQTSPQVVTVSLSFSASKLFYKSNIRIAAELGISPDGDLLPGDIRVKADPGIVGGLIEKLIGEQTRDRIGKPLRPPAFFPGQPKLEIISFDATDGLGVEWRLVPQNPV